MFGASHSIRTSICLSYIVLRLSADEDGHEIFNWDFLVVLSLSFLFPESFFFFFFVG